MRAVFEFIFVFPVRWGVHIRCGIIDLDQFAPAGYLSRAIHGIEQLRFYVFRLSFKCLLPCLSVIIG